MLAVRAESLSSASGTLTGGASAQLVPADVTRNGLEIVVDTAATSTVYLLLGAGTASATNWHIVLAPGGSWDGRVANALWEGAVQFFSSGTPKIGVIEF